MDVVRRFRIVTAGLVLLAGAALAGCDEGEKSQAAPAAPPPPEVVVHTIAAQPVPISAELPGRTTAHLIAEVRPQVTGIIQERLYTEGSDVQAGQPLYQIDPATYQAAYAAAAAALQGAQANVEQTKLVTNRYQSLIKTNAVSRATYDDAVAAQRIAEASVAQAQAALDSARINLDYTKVNAPISGRIGKSSVTPGALVTSGQAQALAVIQQLDPIYVDLNQSSNELLRLKLDLASGRLKRVDDGSAPVRLKLDTAGDYPLEGKLEFSDVTVDESTGTVTLRALFPNPNGLLLPGMFVRATIEMGVDEQGILVPQRGVSRDPRGMPTALVVGADDKVELRQLKVDRTIGDNWLVIDGLKTGDRVIVEGLQKVQPGAVVKIVEPGATPVAQAGAS